MSLLPDVTEASQYTNSGVREVRLSGLASSQRHNEPAGAPVVCRDAGQSQEAILQGALKQAKNIVENARSYIMNQLRESTAQINEEASRVGAAGCQEGFSKDSAEGFEKEHNEGYERGYKQGLQEGRGAGIQELQEQSDRQCVEITRLIGGLGQSKLQILGKLRSEIEALSVQTACKVLHQEVGDGTAVPTIVSSALEEYHDQEWACTRVSPRATEPLQMDPQLMERLQPVSKSLHIMPSTSLEDSDCQIDLPDRQLDVGVETQLREISYELYL